MWQGVVKLIIGAWLIISGLITALQSPLNLLIVGFVTAICCFQSAKIWQATVTGILGIWLFISGLSYFVLGSGHGLIAAWNFLIIGIIILILGIWLLVKPSKESVTQTSQVKK
jgi:uncharacterized membrane protein HdeD (DUF308 family)